MTAGLPPTRILLVGLGSISAVHVQALSTMRGVDVVAGVDIAAGKTLQFQGESRPVERQLSAALDRHGCDVVIVATPSRTHADVCDEILSHPRDVAVLVEKPLATDLDAAAGVLSRAERAGRVVRVLYHAEHGSEVLWAEACMQQLVDEHGPVQHVDAWVSDPYAGLPEERRAALVSSWIDGGVNALSVIDRLVEVESIEALRRIPEHDSTFEARLTARSPEAGATATIVTSWQVTEPAKSSRFEFDDGAALILEHQAVSGRVVSDGRVVAMTGNGGARPRLFNHYQSVFSSVLVGGVRAAFERDLRVHTLLLSRWTTESADSS